MVPYRDKGIWSPGQSQTDLPSVQTEEVPLWLAVLGLIAALTLSVALLRYAIDLLGVAFLIVVVGFSIRTVIDWLKGESVSGRTLGAVFSGLVGTGLVMLWLSGSDSRTTVRRVSGPLMTTVGWLESHGWGQRVLLSDGARGSRASWQTARGRGGAISAAASALDARAKQRADRARPKAGSNASARGASGSAAKGSVPSANVETSTTLVTSSPSVLVGGTVRLTAIVSAATAAGSPTGVVVFERGGVVVGTAPLRPDGSTAALTMQDLPIGKHELVAVYPGVSGFSSSRSAMVRQVVTRP